MIPTMAQSTLILWAVLASLSIIVTGIASTFSFGSDAWSEAGRSRRAWVALMIAFGPLAVLLYWGTVRYDLKDPHRLN